MPYADSLNQKSLYSLVTRETFHFEVNLLFHRRNSGNGKQIHPTCEVLLSYHLEQLTSTGEVSSASPQDKGRGPTPSGVQRETRG